MVRPERSIAKTALLTVTATLSAFLSPPAAATEIVTICGSQPAIVQAPSGSRDFRCRGRRAQKRRQSRCYGKQRSFGKRPIRANHVFLEKRLNAPS